MGGLWNIISVVLVLAALPLASAARRANQSGAAHVGRLPGTSGHHQRQLRNEAEAELAASDEEDSGEADEGADSAADDRGEAEDSTVQVSKPVDKPEALTNFFTALVTWPLHFVQVVFDKLFGTHYAEAKVIEDDTDNGEDDGATELHPPAVMKLRNLAAVAAAVSRHEERVDDNSEARTVRYGQDKAAAREVLHAFSSMMWAQTPLEQGEAQFHVLQEVLSNGAAAKFLTAEAAVAAGQLFTAADLAEVGGMRGEDVGPGDSLPSFQGDMVPESKVQLALLQGVSSGVRGPDHPQLAAGKPWTGARVKYCFASDVKARTRHMFEAATSQYRKAIPCLSFEDVGWESGSSSDPVNGQRCNEQPAIFVTSEEGQGCWSYVGMVSHFPTQRLQLNDPSCTSIGTAVHELGHALGMAHEQARPDRDEYVKIVWENVNPAMKHNFEVVPSSFVAQGYDFLSIMHYDAHAFTTNKKATIVSADGKQRPEIGQRVGLSANDVEQVAMMYESESAKCEDGNALDGLGCIDKPGDIGGDLCKGITACSTADTISSCCACGGGVKVQCYKGTECPGRGVKALPTPAAADCISDVSVLFKDRGVNCAVQNVCPFKVKWTCPNTHCVFAAKAGSYVATHCGGKPSKEVCELPITCSFRKV